ncbi:MAG TPA: tripartite tricarboxylate transporter substrate binding protein [Roseococcus sp.]|jgi:tripartite-type tricarboxylate transporter receptor subunit TctC|nr:tripartite tricarboxylate transporter substrate binding protein [Roseococcus sp.]
MTDAITSRRMLLAAGLGTATALPARAAWAPSQPVRLLIGFPPGGAVDIVIRIVAEGMLRLRGVATVPEVRSGAYGFIAAQGAARAAPDGYTLASAIMGNMSVAPVMPGVAVPFDLDRELVPVSNLAGTPMALVARPDAPFADLQGLAGFAQGRHGAATYASGGTGSINHLAGALLAGVLGVRMTHVPYRGGAPAVLDVTAGRVDVMVANLAEVAGQLRAGQLKGIGITAAQPSAMAPDLAPLAAAVPQLDITNWFGLVGPAGLPADVRTGLADLFDVVLRDAQTTATLRQRGLEPLPEAGPAFAARIRRDRARWRQVIEANAIRSD